MYLKNQKKETKRISKKRKKALTLKNAIKLNGRQKVLNTFESGIFPQKKKKGTGRISILDKHLEISTPK